MWIISLFASMVFLVSCGTNQTDSPEQSDLRQILREHSTLIKNLKDMIERQETIITSQCKEIADLKMEVLKIKPDDNVEEKGDTRRLLLPDSQPSGHTIAFYAYMSKLENVPGAHHIMVFDVVKTNLHNSYNGFTGTFTVPITGLYIFSYNVRVACHSHISFEIMKNGDPIGSVYIDTDNPNICDDDYGTQTIAIMANKGDSVFIRTHSAYALVGSVQSNEYGRSSFAGWLVSASAE